MRLERLSDAAQFYERVQAYLLRYEAHHNLLLGILGGLKRQAQPDVYLSLVEVGGDIGAVAVRTPPHNLVLSLAQPNFAADGWTMLARDIYAVYGALPGVLGPVKEAAAFAECWRAEVGQPYDLKMQQRIYALRTVQPISGVSGSLRRASARDRLLLIDWLAAFGEEALDRSERREAERLADSFLSGSRPALYLWEDDEVVSMAGCSGPTPHGIRVVAVYTPPEHRKRGYASACTAALSQKLLNEGYSFCFLFTDRANSTSNHIYQVIGYERVCDVDEYRFIRL